MKTEIRLGQEWERSAGQWNTTRLRVLEAPPYTSRVKVGTVTKDGRVIRQREILVSALSNTPSGYRLVKDVPHAPRVFDASLGMEEALDAAEKTKPSPWNAAVTECMSEIRALWSATPTPEGRRALAEAEAVVRAVKAREPK